MKRKGESRHLEKQLGIKKNSKHKVIKFVSILKKKKKNFVGKLQSESFFFFFKNKKNTESMEAMCDLLHQLTFRKWRLTFFHLGFYCPFQNFPLPLCLPADSRGEAQTLQGTPDTFYENFELSHGIKVRLEPTATKSNTISALLITEP